MSSGPRPLPTRGQREPERAGGRAAGGFGSVGDRRLRDVPLDAIAPNPAQPRKSFDPVALERLAASLTERGLLQPVLVRPQGPDRYKLIAGERRWRAAQLAGLSHLTAFIRADTDDATALELALTENAARQDLTVVEEARTLSVLLDDLAVTQEVLARRVGRSRSDLTNTVRLLELPDPVLDLLEHGALSKGHGKALLAEPNPDRRDQLACDAVTGSWSVRTLEQAIARPRRHGTSQRGKVLADQAAVGRRLADSLASRVDARVKVTPRGAGFQIQISAFDLAHAHAIVAQFAPRRSP